jgi:hypothetical protein
VRTVSQLQDMQKRGLGRSVGRITNLPLGKLESVLSHATRPMVDDIQTESDAAIENGSGDANGLRHRLRVRGRNLLRDGMPPTIGIGGRPVSIVRATDSELVLAPDFEQMAGQMSLAHDNLASTQIWFDESNKVARAEGAENLQ